MKVSPGNVGQIGGPDHPHPQPGDPSSAIVTIDSHTGYIKAMASSGGYHDRTFNLAAQGHRQPGSSFKPFVLTTAILQGADPDKTIYVSKPITLQTGPVIPRSVW